MTLCHAKWFLSGSLLLLATLIAAPKCAAAEEYIKTHQWHVRLGPAFAGFSDASAKLSVGGQRVPGANASFSDSAVAVIELGYTWRERISVRFAGGIPPTTTVRTKGTLNSYVPPLTGKLAEVTYAPAVLSATYTPLRAWGWLEPYAGIGVTYTIIVDTKDHDLTNIDIDNAFGFVLQAGANVRLHQNWAVFVDVRKLYVGTDGTATVPALGGAPAKAALTLNPLVVHGGAEFRF